MSPIRTSVYIGISTIMLYSLYPSDPLSLEGIYDNIIYLLEDDNPDNVKVGRYEMVL